MVGWRTTGLDLFECLTAASELLLNGFDRSRPDEGSGIFIPRHQELGNRVLQIFHTAEGATAHSFGGQLSKPALDEIEPAGTGRHEVREEAGMSCEPGLHLGMRVSAVVVHHQVQRRVSRKLLVQATQEFQKLLMPMPLVALADDPALQDFQGGKQGRRAMALVVVRHRAAAPLLQRQARLRAIQGLNLAFFIHAEHHGLLWRIQIQADHIGQLLQKPGVARQLETLDPVRLEVVTAPDVVDRGLAHALALRHESATPVRHPLRLGLEGRVHDGFDLFRSIGGLAPATGRDLPQTLQAMLSEPSTPQDHCLPIGLPPPGDRTGRIGRSRPPERFDLAAPLVVVCHAPLATAESVLGRGRSTSGRGAFGGMIHAT